MTDQAITKNNQVKKKDRVIRNDLRENFARDTRKMQTIQRIRKTTHQVTNETLHFLTPLMPLAHKLSHKCVGVCRIMPVVSDV